MQTLAARILKKARKHLLRTRPVSQSHRPVDQAELQRVENKLGVRLPEDFSAWLRAVGYGDVDDILSFRADWFHALEEGHLQGAVIFAQDELGNFYAFTPANGVIHFFARSSPEYATIAPSFRAFMEELERRDFKLGEWMNSLALEPYGWAAQPTRRATTPGVSLGPRSARCHHPRRDKSANQVPSPRLKRTASHELSMLRQTLTLVLSIALSSAASAQATTAKSEQLAEELFSATVLPMAEPIVDRLLLAASRERRLPDAARQIYRDFALELFRSEKYRSANVKAYVATFTEAELVTLVELSKHPGYSLFLSRGQRITELTYPTYTELLNEQRPRLIQRLNEAGLAQ